uniref:Centrosomal protein 128 n=1 Tax=Cyclopterus lumpus TaxID=8103 RepID=A0A8C2X4D8_CYCLU
MDTSSESDSYDRTRGHRSRGREAHRIPGRTRASGGGGDGRVEDFSEKIGTLASTLQDTSRNLTKVDRMLGHYRAHTDDQAEAMALVRHLLCDLMCISITSQIPTSTTYRFYPTSPLRDYTGTPGRRRRSQSASVRFKDTSLSADDIHTLHQSLRDLHCDQHRLSDDLDREILRRNRYLKGGKEVVELRAQLHAASVVSEVEELKRTLDRKEKERLQLSFQVEVCMGEANECTLLYYIRSSFQSQGQAERRETEALLQESTRSRDELKTRAQEAVRQWRAKCRRLQKELEEAQVQTSAGPWQEAGGIALSQQTEAARRELAEILGRLAQREEELHRKDVDLSETRQRQLSLDQEENEHLTALGEETQHLAAAQTRLREENQRLEEQADTQARRCQRDQDTQAELQAALKQRTSAHAQLIQRLAEEENSKQKLQKGSLELQAKLTAVQEERAALGQQLQLERAVHQTELDSNKAMMEDSRTKKYSLIFSGYCPCPMALNSPFLRQADAASDKELCGALRIKLDRMKDECDKLAAQLSTKDEAYALSHRKYQLLKQELDDKVRSGERRRASESELVKLEEKVLRMEAEREAVLTSMGEELDAACRSLAKNGEDKLQVFGFVCCVGFKLHSAIVIQNTKIRWLCEEVRECTTREQRLKKQQQHTRDQLKALRQSRDSEQMALLQRLDQQEKLLHSLDTEKRELLERSRRKEEEMRSLQVSILYLYQSLSNTRIALDHLESIPEKQCLMENFKDLEESQQQREMLEQRYSKYKEIVWDLQHQLDESRRRIQEHRV